MPKADYNLPAYVEDWTWVANTQGLEEMDVTFKDALESLHIHGENAEMESYDRLWVLWSRIVKNLPGYLGHKHCVL